MTLEVKKLREENARATEEQRGIYTNAKKEGRLITNEEEQRFDKLQDEINERNSKIEKINKMAEFEAKQAEDEENRQRESRDSRGGQENEKERYERAFFNYLRRGANGLNAEEQDILSRSLVNFSTRGTNPQTTTDGAGGYTIPEGFSNELEDRMLFFGGMREAARIYRTTTGNPIPWPTVDDTGETGAILNEDSPNVVVGDMTFGQKLLNAYTYHSKIVKVSIPLLQDTAFNLQTFLAEKFAERIGRISNTHFTVGDGSDKPNGFKTAVDAVSGWVDAAGSADITRGDIVDLIHGVDRAYRTPAARLMMNDDTLKAIKKLSFGTSDDRPLYQTSAIVGEADRIEGYQFIVNNDMPNIGTGNTPMAFGDFNKYILRQVIDLQMMRLNERYADQLQVGFIAYMRMDGELIQPNALKLLKNA